MQFRIMLYLALGILIYVYSNKSKSKYKKIVQLISYIVLIISILVIELFLISPLQIIIISLLGLLTGAFIIIEYIKKKKQ